MSCSDSHDTDVGMNLHGFQLRCARVACGLTTRDVRQRIGISLTTLGKLEAMEELPIGEAQRQEGTVEPQIVEALCALYGGLGVTFLPARGGDGPGIRYTPPPSTRASPSKGKR